MSVFSKYFKDAMFSRTCKDIVHPHTDSCIRAACGYFLKPILTTMQFFLPLFMISVAAKKDKFNWHVLWDLLKNFIGVVVAGLLTYSIGTFCMCGFYNLLNKFTYYTLVGLPGSLGAMSVFFVPNKVSLMFAHSAFVMVIGILIKGRSNILFHYLDRWRWFKTLTFMFASAIILDSLRKVKAQISWFIQPVKYKSKRRYEYYDKSVIFDKMLPVTENVCSHKRSCDDFNFKELKTYFKIGLAIEFVRSMLKCIDIWKVNPFKGIYMTIKYFDLKFLLFAIGYPSGYRILTCMFNRLNGFEMKIANTVAAFMAGIFFYAYPELPFLSHAIACCIEIIWQRLQKCKRSETIFLQKIHQLPLSQIFYTIFAGFLFHMRTFNPWQTPSVVKKVVNLVSGGHADKMILNLYAYLIPLGSA